jgi:hypothetical protein
LHWARLGAVACAFNISISTDQDQVHDAVGSVQLTIIIGGKKKERKKERRKKNRDTCLIFSFAPCRLCFRLRSQPVVSPVSGVGLMVISVGYFSFSFWKRSGLFLCS